MSPGGLLSFALDAEDIVLAEQMVVAVDGADVETERGAVDFLAVWPPDVQPTATHKATAATSA